MTNRRGALIAALLVMAPPFVIAQQTPDRAFDVSVASPAFVSRHPRLVIDEAHNNFHTADGRYLPFATLARNDGFDVQTGRTAFTAASLSGVDVLVISNALAPGRTPSDDTSLPAFTAAECAVVAAWVRGGGALLLVADHTPMGAAAAPLAEAFGVTMGQGFAFAVGERHRRPGAPSQLVFSRENGRLGTHPLLEGRNAAERIQTVVSFTGQSLSGPPGSVTLLKLGDDTWEAPTRAALQQALQENASVTDPAAFKTTHARRVAGRAQGLALTVGRGRLVVLGEAAMLSAQVTGPQGEGKMGMNAPGSDDKQFALNVLRWLATSR